MILKKTEFEQLHSYVEESSGNEKNICEITAAQNGSVVYEDYWHGYRRGEKTIYDVTLRHLLTMTAPYKYKSEPWTKVCTSDDWTKAALDLLGGRKGITGEFKYSTLGIQILSGVIANSSGMKVVDFANACLLNRLVFHVIPIRKIDLKRISLTF